MTGGRPKLDTDRVKVTVGVRVLPAVRDRLTAEFGSPGKGVSRIVEEWVRSPERSALDVRELASVDVDEELDRAGVLVSAEEQAASAGPHRHKRGKLLATTYEMGVPQKHYECAIAGCRVTLT
jgi:hypothetical protein